MECAYGQFERAFPLPVKVDETRAQATYKRGVLWVTLPKVAGSGKKRIPVQSQ
jgi:HSP20 family protein